MTTLHAKSSLQIPIVMVTTGIVTMLAAFFFVSNRSVPIGILLGMTLGISNYLFLYFIVAKMLSNAGQNKLMLTWLLLTKFVLIIGILGLAFFLLKVSIISFAAGYATLIPAAIIHQFISKNSNHNKAVDRLAGS